MAVRRAVGRVHRRSEPVTAPTLGEVADIIRRHGALLADHFGEDKGMRDMRKHVAWYLHGFPAGADLRRALALVKTLAELDELLGQLDPTCPSRAPRRARAAVRDRRPRWRCPRAG